MSPLVARQPRAIRRPRQRIVQRYAAVIFPHRRTSSVIARWLLHCTAGLFLGGIVLFSGGLYLIVFTGKLIHWAIVPSGGLLLMAAWLLLAIVAVRISPRP
jgi:uncharacterized membrane protein YgdD (TMEM256/DUF423 family)